MEGRLHPGRRRCAAGRVGLRPGTKGRLRPWDGKLRPGMRLSPGIKGTPHPGMEMSPREWETAPGQTLLLPRRAVSAPPPLSAPGRDGCAPDGRRPLLEGTVSAREALRCREGRVRPWDAAVSEKGRLRPPGSGCTPDRPASPPPPEGAVSAWDALRRGRPGARMFPAGGRPEPSRTIWGDRGPAVNSDAFTSAVGKLPARGWVAGRASH
ncbi:uncharacterized protein LOC116598435 [Mustela erminea]|uniref:uncharacterized protein LOC116598435 n=1 Tax=Mustela erminea TaxID=36723 RepID=UPI001387122B|nr:uncharacterized protein LOC116598435 [Mustela erminea]